MNIDAIVIGAGVIGLACAAELAGKGLSVVVLERESAIGQGISSRNSEVIHAGMYYPTGGLKARLSVRGRALLYDYLGARGLGHRRVEKLIVATSRQEIARIEAIAAQGAENGVTGLSLLDGAAARRLEPALAAEAALWSRETGILDAQALMRALSGDIESRGGAIALATPFLSAEANQNGFRVRCGGASPIALDCRILINSAGLFAQAAAHRMTFYPPAGIPTLYLAKGSYFALAAHAPFTRLIYPAPIDGGLGVHLTLDLAGRARFGPDVEWLADADPEQVDYQVAPGRAAGFYAAIRRYWPALPDGALAPDYAGCRPKITGPGGGQVDFAILGPETHQIPGLVQLFGMESPGLTSALAIAEHVAGLLDL